MATDREMSPRIPSPPRSTNCPCYGDKDGGFHTFLCWSFHIGLAVMMGYLWTLALWWITLSQVRNSSGDFPICGVCDCHGGSRLLCADRGFTSIPKLELDQVSSLSILGFQRNRIASIDGKYLSKFHKLILLDIRSQKAISCVEVKHAPLPENVIVRGELMSCFAFPPFLNSLYISRQMREQC